MNIKEIQRTQNHTVYVPISHALLFNYLSQMHKSGHSMGSGSLIY